MVAHDTSNSYLVNGVDRQYRTVLPNSPTSMPDTVSTQFTTPLTCDARRVFDVARLGEAISRVADFGYGSNNPTIKTVGASFYRIHNRALVAARALSLPALSVHHWTNIACLTVFWLLVSRSPTAHPGSFSLVISSCHIYFLYVRDLYFSCIVLNLRRLGLTSSTP